MSSNSISVDEICHVAKLARIKLSPEEEKTFTAQLSPVLDHINNLNRLDTDNIDPTSQVINLKNVFQSNSTDSFSQKEALASASQIDSAYFVVPQSIDK
jgi:aspartyl-tRNA(Asn)/glutamyl-tRNA(Gln) amidotransferase subunit C